MLFLLALLILFSFLIPPMIAAQLGFDAGRSLRAYWLTAITVLVVGYLSYFNYTSIAELGTDADSWLSYWTMTGGIMIIVMWPTFLARVAIRAGKNPAS